MFENLEFRDNVFEFTRLLNSAKRVFLLSHLFTDADDFGACVGLFEVLKFFDVEACVIVRGELPGYLRDALGDKGVLYDIPNDLGPTDIVVVCGCSSLERTGFVRDFDSVVINIDHHPDNTYFGSLNFVYPKASSASEIAYWIAEVAQLRISSKAAKSFLLGILSDTGLFRFSNTDASSFKAAAGLVKHGAVVHALLKYLSGARREHVALAWKEGITQSRFNNSLKCVSVAITSQKTEPGSYDGLVDFLNRAKEVDFTILSRQEGEFIKTSLRSSPSQGVDVGELARAFGGGGHKYASGFTLKGKLGVKGGAISVSVSDSGVTV